MQVSELLTSIRYRLSDERSNEYTDAELIGYLNDAQDKTYTMAIDKGSTLALASGTYTRSDSTDLYVFSSTIDGTLTLNAEDYDIVLGFDLPKSFQLETAVYNADTRLESTLFYKDVTSSTYSIYNRKLYSDNDEIRMTYYYLPSHYTSLTDELTSPRLFDGIYKDMVVFMALNSNEFDTSVEQSTIYRFERRIMSIIGKYGNSNIRAVMPFMV